MKKYLSLSVVTVKTTVARLVIRNLYLYGQMVKLALKVVMEKIGDFLKSQINVAISSVNDGLQPR